MRKHEKYVHFGSSTFKKECFVDISNLLGLALMR